MKNFESGNRLIKDVEIHYNNKIEMAFKKERRK